MSAPLHTIRPRAPRKNLGATPFLPPYEVELGRPVHESHGGYGAVAEGYIVGPFFCLENAQRRVDALIGGRVVRWIDFVIESSKSPTFLKRLRKLTEPLTVKIDGYLKQVHVPTAE